MEQKVITQETYAKVLQKLWDIDKSPETERLIQQEAVALRNYRSPDMSKRFEEYLEPSCVPLSLLMACVEVAKELVPSQVESLERTTERLLSPTTRINIPIVLRLTKQQYLKTAPTNKSVRISQILKMPEQKRPTEKIGNGNGSAELRQDREKIIEFITQVLVPYRAGVWGKPNPHAIEFLLRTRTLIRHLIETHNNEWLVKPELFLAALKKEFPE